MSGKATMGGGAAARWMAIVAVLLPHVGGSQSQRYALESVRGLKLHGVVAEAATLHDKKGVRLEPDSASRAARSEPDMLAIIDGPPFTNGVIEAEIAGTPGPAAVESARGFVGIAFRVSADGATYDAFYLRPTNGRANDQERRNHAAQYISHPGWPWSRLRQETPSKYEAYVDVVPNEWTKIKIEVQGTQARLYVNDQAQPTLIVNDVKTGANGSGAVALWIGAGTIGHFRDLRVDRK
jgi:hypothetical protein